MIGILLKSTTSNTHAFLLVNSVEEMPSPPNGWIFAGTVEPNEVCTLYSFKPETLGAPAIGFVTNIFHKQNFF